jgi:hypothetical protein
MGVNTMALSIINIQVNVTSTVERFFNVLAAPLAITPASTVAVADFFDDTGVEATDFPIIVNGYYNLYINGVMQERGTFTVAAATITFNSVTATLTAGTPLILEAVEFNTLI